MAVVFREANAVPVGIADQSRGRKPLCSHEIEKTEKDGDDSMCHMRRQAGAQGLGMPRSVSSTGLRAQGQMVDRLQPGDDRCQPTYR